MTLAEAAAARVPRIRHTAWADPSWYYRLPLLPGGTRGPLVELFDARQHQARGFAPGIAVVLSIDTSGFLGGFEVYRGPTSYFEVHPTRPTYMER